MRDLFETELKDLYSAEKQLIEALPKMVDAATEPELREAFESHLGQTQEHARRLERVFQEIDTEPRAEMCEAMKGLIEESSEIMGETADEAVRDAALIGAAQKVEHYEIASYGTLRTFAEHLGLFEAIELLQETLDEEREADLILTQVAQSLVNLQADMAEDVGESSADAGEESPRGKTTRRGGSSRSHSAGAKAAGSSNKRGRSSRAGSARRAGARSKSRSSR
jgi:ferritin-like metal-binding protein YciE